MSRLWKLTKAIEEQSLGRIILLTEFANSAQNELGKDWDSQEDSIYDTA